ncbi:DUF4215 domain-containing protein [Myxococcus qinghaiensis]|uniref:DUF4215 domain-containing protein n=1 Tax=Myxococcus qinghaiensis TaxID=2906758 RepID=UPI0020A79747|nr:DUF4215 domain-containing protein [Myxococcus qinghaiensis]MCP3168682.1 DUF4215 domain-containing protein [Myxococcus qinghaiensis]
MQTPLRLASVLFASLVLTLVACGHEDDAPLSSTVKDPWRSPAMELEPGCGEPDAGPATDAGTPPPDAGPALCGDSVKHPSEECDDGNLRGQDGCSAYCQLELP